MKILLIEDDIEAAGYLAQGLRENGHQVDVAHTGDQGLQLALEESFDVLIVDRMLPELDGLTVLSRLRERRVYTPALILSALGDVDHRVEGLKAGGDDYLSKPYAFAELLARLEALNRRSEKFSASTEISVGGFTLETDRDRLKAPDGRSVELNSQEMKILDLLLRNSGKVVTRSMLLERVWGITFNPKSNLVDAQVCRLRQKLLDVAASHLIETVRGKGYRIRAD